MTDPNVTSQNNLTVHAFEARRQALGMSYGDLARLSHVSLATINRFFKGTHPKISFDTVLRMADILDMSILPTPIKTIHDIKVRQSDQLAEQIMAGVSAASALESQNINAPDRKNLKKEIAARLLSGSPRHLWTEIFKDPT